MRTRRRAAVIGGLALGAALLALLLARAGAAVPPELATVRARWQPAYAYLLDRHGAPLQALRMDRHALRREWVELADVSPALLAALVRIEDRRFHAHGGVDVLALGAAASQRLRALFPGQLPGAAPRGGSTITMQLAALLEPQRLAPSGRRGVAAKWAQMRAAWALERRWSKAQILEAYVNLVSFRGERQGVAAAAHGLFGKSAAGLDAAESLLLATLVSAPNASRERLLARACRLAAAGVSCRELAPLVQGLGRAPAPPEDELAPQLARRLLRAPGERAVTTLDAPLQRALRDMLERQLAALAPDNVRDGAAVVLDNATGELLAYVASAGSASRAREVDGAAALRQAGSTLKPVLYGLAFDRGLITPASLLDDSPLSLETASGLYIPQNYDRGFKGVVSARTALASSLNIPAIRTLVLVGVEGFRERLQDFGYADIDRDGDHYGYSLALGSAEVTLLQQANAYRALANGGLWSPVSLRREASAAQASPRRVLSTAAAFLVSEALADSAARALTFGLDSALATPFWSAVKTGTSKDLRDNWCIGYSERYTVAVWMGNFEGDSMREVSGVAGAAPVWLEAMRHLHARVPSREPAPPAGVVARQIVFVPALEPPRRGFFLAGTESERIELLPPHARPARIVSPANGAVIALDPDIPMRNQRVPFESRVADAGSHFFLDGARVASGALPARWVPVAGEHELELRGADGRVRDRVRFTVRGAP